VFGSATLKYNIPIWSVKKIKKYFSCHEIIKSNIYSSAPIATVKVPKSRAKKMKMGTEAMLKVEENAKEETKEKEDWFR
jgi:hypothetical protein